MHTREGSGNSTELTDELLEAKLLGEHAKEIGALANNGLDPVGVQERRAAHSVSVGVGLHLEHEVLDVSEAEAAVPARLRQQEVGVADV